MKNFIFSCIESRVDENQGIYGCYKIGPFVLDQGVTIASILRHTLLSNLSGIAIVCVQIEGISHEYSVLKGAHESVLDILVNLKQIRLHNLRSIFKPQIAYLNVKGPRVVKAKDIQLPYLIQFVNPDQYIATLSSNGKLNMKIYICEGRRYVLQHSLELIIKKQFKKIIKLPTTNILVLDAVFFPIDKINYTIQVNNFLQKEFIIFEIWTKNNLHPRKAILQGINEILKIFLPFRLFTLNQKDENDLKQLLDKNEMPLLEKDKTLTEQEVFLLQRKILLLDIGNLDISPQIYCVLKKNNINIINDLMQQSRRKIKYLLHNKSSSIEEINNSLLYFGLSFRK